jgi:hypothetical protein
VNVIISLIIGRFWGASCFWVCIIDVYKVSSKYTRKVFQVHCLLGIALRNHLDNWWGFGATSKTHPALLWTLGTVCIFLILNKASHYSKWRSETIEQSTDVCSSLST